MVYNFQGSRLGFRRKIFLHVDLTQRFSEPSIRGCHTALPSRQQLGCPLQCTALEIEVLVDERLRQPRRSRIQNVPAKINFPIADGNFLEFPVHYLEKLWG